VRKNKWAGGFTLAIIFFSKFFPMISIWEMEKKERKKNLIPNDKVQIPKKI
jgi:hypothetical protein